ncbi:MAG TPA: CRISPR system precrRNA processing endoribonuclease RAMP protein Cas6 [Pseudonocardiaceae bacterium]|jgi:CRISPR-associated endoribonuclease Cas6|nr:CRISPR system precrRNA processing endoribonuclease RAMP protein Cas6 [Pseudonocardiaceae bacterium]
MPTSLILRIPELAVLPYPAHLHGAACQLFEQSETDHTAQRKPFAIGAPLAGEGAVIWRLGWLPDAALPASWPPRELRLGESVCQVLDAHARPCSFAELTTSRPVARGLMRFMTPTYFSRNGRDVPLPDPVLIMRSLLQRWNSFAPDNLAIGEELGKALLSAVLLADASINTMRVRVGHAAWQTGFVGDAELGLTRTAAPGVSTVFAALLRFATIAGVGAQTTYGFGEVSPELLAPHASLRAELGGHAETGRIDLDAVGS